MKINFMKKAATLSLAIGIIFSTANITNAKESFDWAAERAREQKIIDEFHRTHVNMRGTKNGDDMFENSKISDIIVTVDSWSSENGDVPFKGHAAIIWDSFNTIESNTEDGVQRRRSARKWYGRTTMYMLRHPQVADTQKAYDIQWWAQMQIRKPYNKNFLDRKTTDSFYCSQLVWSAYVNAANIDLCPGAWSYISPADLLNCPDLYNYYRQW